MDKRRNPMKLFRSALGALAMILMVVAIVAPTWARQTGLQNVSKKNTVTITKPMEIPGQVLPPGTYVFKVMDIVGTRNIMQVTNADETKVLATIIAVHDYRVQPRDNSVVQYQETPAGKPNAMRAWFYAGEKAGLEFVYPKTRAVELAAETHEYVPAMVAGAKPEELATAPLTAITPEGKEEPMSQAYQEPREVAQTLPKTASPAPLIALLGLTFLAVGFGLRQMGRSKA
jgi:hypothetical protein